MVTTPSTPGIYEWNAVTGVWTSLTPYEVVDDTLADQPLTVDLTKISATAPAAAYNLILVSKTDTTINVRWSEDPDPQVTGHRIYVNGVKYGADLAPSAFSAAITGRTASTTYTVDVRRINSLGQESPSSNILSVTTNAATVGVPVAPLTLTQTSITNTSVGFNWTVATDSSVLREWRYLDGVRFGTSLGPNVLNSSITGLTANTAHTAYITRENATGESPPSPVLSFRTTGGTGVVHDMAMGVSNSDENHKITQWDSMRVYTTSVNTLQGLVNNYGVRILCVTDPTLLEEGTATSAAGLNASLTSFYGWTEATGPTKNLNVEYHFANGNETDTRYKTGSLPAAYIETYRQYNLVINAVDTQGRRKWPNASLWVDMTQNNIRSSGTGARFKAIAMYLDGMACSQYPPGRMQQPTRWDDYATFAGGSGTLGPLDTVQDWYATYPQCHQYATWEIGSPIDHCTAWNATAGFGGEPTALTDWSIRPRWFAGGKDHTGKVWEGFPQYVWRILNPTGIRIREQNYWDQQVINADGAGTPGPPNPFWHDTNRTGVTGPDTATAWRNWTIGSKLPDAP